MSFCQYKQIFALPPAHPLEKLINIPPFFSTPVSTSMISLFSGGLCVCVRNHSHILRALNFKGVHNSLCYVTKHVLQTDLSIKPQVF